MKMRIEMMQELVAHLEGSSSTINDALPEGMTEDDLTQDELLYLDEQIMLCVSCNWWCAIE